MRLPFAIVLCISVLAVAPALAQNIAARDVPKYLEESAIANPKAFRKRSVDLLFRYAPEGTFTPEDAALFLEIEAAQQRQRAQSDILKLDLDGDAVVSREEVDRLRTVLTGRDRSNLENMLDRLDTDNNLALSAEEIEAGVAERLAKRKPNRDIQTLLDLDVDGILGTTLADIDQIVAFTEGTAEAQQNLARLAIQGGTCDLPMPTEKAQVVVLGAYEADRRSRVNVHGSSGKSGYFEVIIEDAASEPIYLVVIVHSAVVVKLVGKTDMVERVVALSSRSIGVAGLDEERVTFASPRACATPIFTSADSADGLLSRAAISAKLDRQIDTQAATYTATTFALPAGEFIPTPKPAPKSTLDMLVDLFLGRAEMGEVDTGKVGDVDRAEIVTVGGLTLAGAYDHPASLMPLIQSKHVSRRPDGSYSIDKAFDVFPPDMESVTLILRGGIPMPRGDIGRATIINEDTGACSGRCPR